MIAVVVIYVVITVVFKAHCMYVCLCFMCTCFFLLIQTKLPDMKRNDLIVVSSFTVAASLYNQ